MLAVNPTKAVSPPKPSKNEMKALTREEANQLLEALQGHFLWLPTFLAVTSGMRRGELLGLKWDDIDWDKRTLTVKRSLKQSKGQISLEKPKTRYSLRTITLSDIVISALRVHKRAQAEERLRLGSIYTDRGLVLPAPGGGFLAPDTLSTNFATYIRRHPNLAKLRFHDLRHTHASLLLQAGENAKVVSERLGHASVAFTLDTYGHLLPGMEAGAASKIDEIFESAGPK
jgi:integrase